MFPVGNAAGKPALPAAAVQPIKAPNPAGGLLSSGRWQDPEQARSSPHGLALRAAAPSTTLPRREMLVAGEMLVASTQEVRMSGVLGSAGIPRTLVLRFSGC